MTIIISLIVFGIIILFHEFGHFIMAKMAGVKVHEFAIGMGPKLFGFKGEETEYTIRILPLGGYVKMEGEDENSNDPRSFNNKSIFQRIGIILAGPLMNFILAIILFTGMFMYMGIPSTIIKETIDHLPAQKVGIKAGDKIVKINDIKVKSWEDIVKKISTSQDEKINIKVNRDGKLISYDVAPQKQKGKNMIGIVPKEEKNMLLSFEYAIKQTFYILNEMIHFLGKAISGKASTAEVTGPVGIVDVVGKAAKAGIINVISLAALISLNLGLLNLLPIPALDGSRILFLLIELIRGKKVDPDKEGTIHFVGFVALMLLMIFITYKDVLRIIK